MNLRRELVNRLIEKAAGDTAKYIADFLRQEYKNHEGKWWLVSSGKLQRPLSLDEVIWSIQNNDLLPDCVYFLAGSIRQMSYYVDKMDIPPKKAKYLFDPHSLCGQVETTVIVCGTAYERQDYSRFIEFLESRDAAIYIVYEMHTEGEVTFGAKGND